MNVHTVAQTDKNCYNKCVDETKDRRALLESAFEMLLKLSTEQLLEIMEGIV